MRYQAAFKDAAKAIGELAENLPVPVDGDLSFLALTFAASPLNDVLERLEVEHYGLFMAVTRRMDDAHGALSEWLKDQNEVSHDTARKLLRHLADFLARWSKRKVPDASTEPRLPDAIETRILEALAPKTTAQNQYDLEAATDIPRATIGRRLPAMVEMRWITVVQYKGASITPEGRALVAPK